MKRFLIRIPLAGALAVALGVTAVLAQTVQLQKVMRAKLEQSQGLLAALVTSNWNDLQRRSEELARLTRDPAWAVMIAPQYASHAAAFLRAVEDLAQAAQRRDGESAPLAYVSLTLTCVRCHQAVARSRLAELNTQSSARPPSPASELHGRLGHGMMGAVAAESARLSPLVFLGEKVPIGTADTIGKRNHLPRMFAPANADGVRPITRL
jgi:hypothetical protein